MLTFNLSREPARQSLTPFVDIYELPNRVVVLADMPGVSKAGVDIRVIDNRLMIRGQCPMRRDGVCLIGECAHYDYYRSIKLSAAIDAENIQAEMKDGVLTSILPKRRLGRSVEASISIEDEL